MVSQKQSPKAAVEFFGSIFYAVGFWLSYFTISWCVAMARPEAELEVTWIPSYKTLDQVQRLVIGPLVVWVALSTMFALHAVLIRLGKDGAPALNWPLFGLFAKMPHTPLFAAGVRRLIFVLFLIPFLGLGWHAGRFYSGRLLFVNLDSKDRPGRAVAPFEFITQPWTGARWRGIEVDNWARYQRDLQEATVKNSRKPMLNDYGKCSVWPWLPLLYPAMAVAFWVAGVWRLISVSRARRIRNVESRTRSSRLREQPA